MKKLKPYQKVSTKEELDTILNINSDPVDFFIFLNGGFRSSKWISFDDNGDYLVLNEIDDSYETIPSENFMGSFIGKAITSGAFYKY